MILLLMDIFVFAYAALCVVIAIIAFASSWARRSEKVTNAPKGTISKG